MGFGLGSIGDAFGRAADAFGGAVDSATDHTMSAFNRAMDTVDDAATALSKASWSDIGHTALDVAGMVPVIGEAADLANAGWYLAEGDHANAALSAAGAIPFAGNAATAAKWGSKAVDAAGTVARNVDTATDAARVVDNATDAAKAAEGATDAAKVVDEGVVYRVPGNATESGQPYVGRSDDLAQRTKNARDGRDRTQAEVIDTYPKGDTAAARTAEQRAINENGGVANLDNKRNEIAPSKWGDFGIE